MQEIPVWFLGQGRCPGKGIGYPLQYSWASLVAQLVQNPPAMQETWVWSWFGKIPWKRERLLTPVFWPGEFHELYSPWGCKESDINNNNNILPSVLGNSSLIFRKVHSFTQDKITSLNSELITTSKNMHNYNRNNQKFHPL